jgi:SAM-dependent methyltransferase
MPNADESTVRGFGDEWRAFDHGGRGDDELRASFDEYFSIFPWASLPPNPVGFDLGCGSGRWARIMAPRVGRLHCIDASAGALDVAKRNLGQAEPYVFHHASVDAIPLDDSSMDFGYSLGVLHHVPDTAAAIRACVAKLKRGAPLLLYLYYAFDNRPAWFRLLWQASDAGRRVLSRAPFPVRFGISQAIAAGVYFPLARAAALAEKAGADVRAVPLSYYRHKSFYAMRTDALDRFGTRLEQRFTAEQIERMMIAAGLEDVRFRDGVPYWCAVGRRA